MSQEENKYSVILHDGTRTEVELSLETYRQAEEVGMSLSQYVNAAYPTRVEENGTAFAQMMAGSGMFLSEDRTFGIRPPSMKAIFDGTAQLNGGAVVRPDGSNSRSPSGRLLFPAVLVDVLESTLRENKEGYVGNFLSLVAQTRSINSPKYEQVIIDHSNPQAARGQPIAQLDRPVRMLTLKTSDITRTIPTYAIGLEISREAQAAATLDLVAMAIREHALEERAAIVDRDMKAMFNGDVDSGYSALSSVQMNTFDAAITTNGTLTQKAWVKYLRNQHRRRSISHVFCDIDTYLAIEGRAGRPVKEHEPAQDERLNTIPRVSMPGIPDGVSIFLVEDPTIVGGANTLVGIDARKAIRRVVFTGAEYSAVEEFVMRKSTVYRMDWAERFERMGYDQAYSKATLTV